MKKSIFSAVLALVMMISIIPAGAIDAVDGYPESPHNYSNNFSAWWTYVHPEETDRLYVTFSEDTYFGPKDEYLESDVDSEDDPYYDYDDCYGDYLEIIACDYYAEDFYEDDLAGKTICIPGNEFTIVMSTNGVGRYYGFKITDISTEGSDRAGLTAVTYHLSDDRSEKDIFRAEDSGELRISGEYRNMILFNKAIIGWKDEAGNEFYYNSCAARRYGDEYTDVFTPDSEGRLSLYPIFTPLSITTDEVFSFNNGYSSFENGYEMTDAHAKRLRKSYISSTWFTPLGFLGVPLGLILPGIYQKWDWGGSCCGFPPAILMQHYGLIDLTAEQGVDTVAELEPTENLTSALNFYNAAAPAGVLCANKASVPGSEDYKAQVKKLYETVESGKPVICYINCGYLKNLTAKGVLGLFGQLFKDGISETIETLANTHCILLTGAYTDSQGNLTFIGYDENEASYNQGEPQIYVVKGDYEDVVEVSYYGIKYSHSLGAFAWLDDVSCYNSFKADGDIDPTAWYSYYLSHK